MTVKRLVASAPHLQQHLYLIKKIELPTPHKIITDYRRPSTDKVTGDTARKWKRTEARDRLKSETTYAERKNTHRNYRLKSGGHVFDYRESLSSPPQIEQTPDPQRNPTLPEKAAETPPSSKEVAPACAAALPSSAGRTGCGVAADLSAMAPLFAPFLSRGSADRLGDYGEMKFQK
jgi:hypothetical protein